MSAFLELTGIGPKGKEKMSNWITKTIKELLGEEEQTLVRTPAPYLSRHT